VLLLEQWFAWYTAEVDIVEDCGCDCDNLADSCKVFANESHELVFSSQ
jgi:hypothetical protein